MTGGATADDAGGAATGKGVADGPRDEVRYLSDEWLRLADAAVADLPPLETGVEVGVRVVGGPDGERAYRLVLGPDRVGVAPGPGRAGVRMTLAWDVAVAIATGEASAQRQFLDGRLRIGGDAGLLLGHQAALAALDDRLAELRSRTAYR